MKKIILILITVLILIVLGIWWIPSTYLSNDRSFEEITIQGDGYQLHGFVSEGKDTSGEWVVLLHGNRKQGQEHLLYQSIREFLPVDYSILAVDFRGFGGSVGNGKNQFPASIDRFEDLVTVSEFLSDNYMVGQDQIVVIGHSYGAAQVFQAAQDQDYLLVIPIGLGDWDALIVSEDGINSYMQKFESNTGIQVERSVLVDEAEQFTTGSLFTACPESPVWLVYASQDDAIPVHSEAFQNLSANCNGKVQWSEIPFSDHMYGTELFRLPDPLRGIYSRISLSLLKYRLDRILRTVSK